MYYSLEKQYLKCKVRFSINLFQSYKKGDNLHKPRTKKEEFVHDYRSALLINNKKNHK